MTGFRLLLAHFLHRDWWIILVWSIGITLLYYVQAPSVDGMYPTQAEFDTAAEAMGSNAAFVAMAGPPRALNTVGGQVAWQATAFGAVLLGLMSMFLLGRHTRVEEETGRDELLRSAVVGRHAPQTAALAVVGLANLLAGVLISASLLGYGLGAAGSLALGVGAGAVGACFTGVAFLAAQLTQGARAMYGITGTVIAVSYVLRAVGDVGNGMLSWLSPIGWYQAMHAYSGERWWPLLLSVVTAGLLVVVGYRLFDHRDVGAGLLPDRPGPPRASEGLLGEFGLAWRLHRSSLAGWATGLFLGGAAYGTIGDDVASMMGDSETTLEIFGATSGDLTRQFYATSAMTLVLLAGAYAVSSALRPGTEEGAGRVETLLATGLTRWRWLRAHTLLTLFGTVLVAALAGVGMGLSYAAVTGDAGAILRFTGATLGAAPAALVLAGVARLMFGLLPRWASLAWLAVAFCAVVMLFGVVLRFPDWLLGVSPFEHLARVPAEDFAWLPWLVVFAIGIVLSTGGRVGFLRRDVR